MIKNYLHGHGQLQNNLHQSWAIENDLHHWWTTIIYSQMIENNFHHPWQSKVICITHVQLKTIQIVDFLDNQKWSAPLIYCYLDQQKWFFTIHGQLKIISTTHE
jgi:hypothetical protein